MAHAEDNPLASRAEAAAELAKRDSRIEVLTAALEAEIEKSVAPIPIRLTCPECGELHIDAGKFATMPHHTHSCQKCGLTWRPAVVPTVGVRFLPGFKNDEGATP